jgi:PPOX class probable FMN-dependent enzyme
VRAVSEVCDEPPVCDEEALRSQYRSPRFLADLDKLDRSCRYFISRSPIVVIGTSHPDRGIDVSPRGDAPGFVRILDDHTLAIPDRTGNNRLDSMTNLLADDRIGLFFMIPGVHETLRVKGYAEMSRDPELIAESIVDGKPPKTILIVKVKTAFLHCGKALLRSCVWTDAYRADPKAWLLARGTLENSNETLVEIA